MVDKLAAQGTKDSNSIEWDDGSDYDDVTKITVGGNSAGIQYIWFEYLKGQNSKEGSRVGTWEPGFTQTFEINHLNNEQLESVEVYYKPGYTTIRGIQFKTTLRFFELIGYAGTCSKFSLSMEGKKIIGFHGSTGIGLDTLGAYFNWIVPTKSEAIGGNDGKEWDDGIDHEAVTKINLIHGRQGVQYIKFDYLKNGKHLDGSDHGVKGHLHMDTFEIDHVGKEYLESIEGYFQSGVIQGLEFITNLKTSETIGYEDGEKFKLAIKGKKIIGFHGISDDNNLSSLGAYFTNTPFTKLNSSSAYTSSVYLWDDGTFDGIRKVCVRYDSYYIHGVTFYYDDGGKIKKSEHGVNTSTYKMDEFELDYPYEFITSVEGTYRSVGYTESLTFKTSKGRTSPTFGTVTNSNIPKFVLESKGCGIVGFHGYGPNKSLLYQTLGAYFRPLPTFPDYDQVEAEGGDGGTSWDDGCFEGVRMICIGLNENAIAFIKFMYYKDTKKVFGDDHGSKTLPSGIEEFELDYPNEYVISVEGSYDTESGAMTMLRFTTNTRTSPDFGVTTTKNSSFVLHKDDHKVVGFYGSSSSMLLYKIGVHLIPITQKSSPSC